ncbi:MAG: response regulator, partial [Synergistaceae bacterium]|nr:response regulator [Synergistaceae bacterium]
TRFTAPSALVLIVDDIATNLKVAAELLSPYKLQADTCSSGDEAVRMAREKRYDIIFMDHMMPGMDGVAATEAIRALGGGYFKEVPIIALTANAVFGMREMFLEHGFSDYLPKPIEVRKLDEMLERWIPAEKRASLSDVEAARGEPASGSALLPEELRLKETLDAADIDFDKAMDRFGNNTEALARVLRSYVSHTPAILENLRAPTEETLREYAINAHGIKGSSYGVCADAVGRLAEELEAAAKGRDLELVLAKNDALLAMAEKLIEDLSHMPKSLEASMGEKDTRAAPDKSTLEAVADACLRYDMTALEKAVSDLERFDYENHADLVAWLRNQLDNLEYEAIGERLANELADWNDAS